MTEEHIIEYEKAIRSKRFKDMKGRWKNFFSFKCPYCGKICNVQWVEDGYHDDHGLKKCPQCKENFWFWCYVGPKM